MVNSAAIGIFDSGIGGLSVARAVRELLPNESLIYVADSGHAPYGEKTDDYIYQRMDHITRHLTAAGVKAIVVACNTATTAAIARLRAQYPLPIIGVEPGVKPAVLASKSGVVGVLATPRTLLTPAFATLAQRYAGQAKVILQPCPQLVPLIEALDFSGNKMQALLQSYIQPLLAQGADTLVLGCTHYNFVADLIAEIAGPDVSIIRTEMAVAKQLQQRLIQTQLLSSSAQAGADKFYSSGDLELFNRQLQQFWPDVVMAGLKWHE
ncbi:glutamate racemase [Rheinheimera oceanensis]|uniref:glutamate racemase n=1 Tax=Rheinheimera oceanensis TaxID=2817449 RepID=UPI001BFD6977|nr:glutamate racemase [Rheinheimera oceanensis]